ncbi:hypothetical protein GEMRC1_002462 [Eukaryota sp. GEM-RC1]
MSLNGNAKRIKPVKFPAFDAAVYEWFLAYQDRIVMTDEVITTKAKTFRTVFQISDNEIVLDGGWLYKFNNRYNIRSLRLSGEAASRDKPAVLSFLQNIDDKLEGFDAEFVFSLDETGLYYRMQPSRTNANKKIEGHKTAKDRLTLVLCCNMTSTFKLPLYMVVMKIPAV